MAIYEKNQDRKEQMIQKALDKGLGMLLFSEFIKTTGFKLKEILSSDMMWNTFKRDIPIYITDELIRIFGYKGELKIQKLSLMKLIKKYDIPIIQMNNDEYNKFTSSLQATPNNEEKDINNQNNDSLNLVEIYPKITKAQLKSKPTHNFIMPRDLKRLFLVVDTENGDKAREYMISLEEAFTLYTTYQIKYENNIRLIAEKHFEKESKLHEETRKLFRETKAELKENRIELQNTRETLDETNDRLDDLRDKLDIASDQRVLPTSNRKLREKFILLRLNDEDDTVFDYYVIRCQTRAIKKAIQKIREVYPEAERILTITCQPNSKNLYNRIKEELANNIEVYKNYISPYNMSHARFIKRIREINEERYDLINDEDSGDE
jgi:hypothetical protein